MSHNLADDFDTVQQLFQELWRSDRAALRATVGDLVDRLAAVEGEDNKSVDWEQEITELTRIAEATARSMPKATANSELVAQALLLCAVSLQFGLAPSAPKLSVLRSLADHSWVLEHSLTAVILAAMNQDEATRVAWLELVKGWLPQPDPEQQTIEGRTWGDVLGPIRSNVSPDALIAPLKVLLEIDSTQAFAYLDSFRDWEFVEYALLLSGAVSTFAKWSTALARASSVFGDSGEWTGSMLGLVLVKRAQEELLLSGGEVIFGRPSSELPWSREQVIAEIRRRSDWLSLLRCWSVTSFRDYIDITDSESRNHEIRTRNRLSLLEQIFEGVPAEVRQTRPAGELPARYPAWFVWYERALEVRWHQQSDCSSVPTAQVIALYRELVKWDSVICQDVRFHRARIRFGRLSLVVGQLDFHLGAAVAAGEEPAKAWHALWQNTLELREMTEFGGRSGIESEDWQDRSAASALTELVFRLGLAVAETLLQPTTDISEGQRSETRSLLCLLQACAMEMASIELVNADIWTQALRYVLLLWGRFGTVPMPVGDNEIIATVREEGQLLEHLSTDPMELLVALTVCERNGIAERTLARQLTDARIDLASCLSQAKMFSEMSRPGQGLSESSVMLAERLGVLMKSIDQSRP